MIPQSKTKRCPSCNGSGETFDPYCPDIPTICFECGGEGTITEVVIGDKEHSDSVYRADRHDRDFDEDI